MITCTVIATIKKEITITRHTNLGSRADPGQGTLVVFTDMLRRLQIVVLLLLLLLLLRQSAHIVMNPAVDCNLFTIQFVKSQLTEHLSSILKRLFSIQHIDWTN